MFKDDDTSGFSDSFTQRLREMLSPMELGAYILMLANSLQDQRTRVALGDELEQITSQLRDNIRSGALVPTDDDRDVFDKLGSVDPGIISVWRRLPVGDWDVMTNPFRALRPARNSKQVITELQKPFDPDGFHFAKPFLRPEIFREDVWQGTKIRALYNKFPFIPYHLLLVPEPDSGLMQYLTRYYHEMMFGMVDQIASSLDGFGIGFNSLGACASVNHLHFHSFISEQALPVERPYWHHNGGDRTYPISCDVFVSAEEAWHHIEILHANNQPYNILYRPDRCYVLQRKRQGADGVNPTVQGAGWVEECGLFVAGSRADIDKLNADQLTEDLQSLSAGPVIAAP